ncbi:MAG: DinB family protein [Armatimonadetes bacterium]|nr:DinB family protein [Anaerolineae bacterium]
MPNTSEQHQQHIATLRAFPDQLEALVNGLSAEQLTTAYLPGEWTVAQNVHHLADSHLNAYIRLKLMLAEDNPTIKPYDQEVWAQQADATDADIRPSLLILRGLHTRWTQLFDSLTEAQWVRPGYHPEVGAISPDWLAQHYHEHCLAHIDQITRTLAAS